MHVSSRLVSNGPAQALRRPILQDSFGRKHDYLRVSLTERCNLRCRYCMPAEGIVLTPRDECLSLDEIKRLTSVFVGSCGVKKIRLTGGEPTVDRKLMPILEHLNTLRQDGLEITAMTTNGLTLKRNSSLYKDLGLNMVNISLDTLRPDKFEQMTRRKGWHLVRAGLERALEIKFDKVKLNCVVMRNFNLDELLDFAQLAQEHPLEVRFIEFMPFMGNKWAPDELVPYKEMLSLVREAMPDLRPLDVQATKTLNRDAAAEVSKQFKQPNMRGSVGFITSMTDNFCSGCNRLRLTSDGNLKVCLFGKEETSLRDLLRNGATDLEIIGATQQALAGKRWQHAGMTQLPRDVSRPMIKIARRMFHSTTQCAARAQTTRSGGEAGGDDGQPDKEINFERFSHLDQTGKAKMVNIGPKARVRRVAMARGEISIGKNVLDKLLDGSLGTKGDILTVAKLGAIMGAKATCNLIPMCHQIPLDHIQVEIVPRQEDGSLLVSAKVEAEHKTGVELECLTAVTVGLLTIYDMCKSISRDMVISDVRLIYKTKLAERP